jgi:simple sugar transport system permease protein
VLIAGRFDLSLESTVGFAPMLAAWLLAPESLSGAGLLHSQVWAVPIVLAAGALVGLVNGFMIVIVRLNAFMVTLAMLILLRGLTYAMTDGATISGPPSSMVFIGQKVILGVPIEIYLVIGLFIVAAIVMRYHRFGRAIYAIGGNEEAARAAGLRVNQRLMLAYVLAGLLSAIAGMILAGQVDAVTTQQGSGLIFTVFAASVIGGISLNGGRGAMIGAGLGVLFLSLIGNVMTLAQVPSQVIDAVRGLVILAALLVNRFTFEED